MGMKWRKMVPWTDIRNVVANTNIQNDGVFNACLVVKSPSAFAFEPDV